MDQIIDSHVVEEYVDTVHHWLLAHVITVSTLIQLVAIAIIFVVAWALAGAVRKGLTHLSELHALRAIRRTVLAPLVALSFYLTWLILQWVAVAVASKAGWSSHALETAASLLTAWVVIRLVSGLVRDPAWSHFVAVVAWTIAALNILGLLDDTIAVLDGIAVQLGGVRLSALVVIKALLALGILLWVAMVGARLLERRIGSSPNLTPSVQVLISKLLKATFIAIAIVAALGTVGIDLSAFALFGGALGLGIGFGLQKVISNLISGVILLLDKSIKPGDVIGVAGTYGWIRSLGARYASVITRDGIEHLIPNEELITTRVENWSHSGNDVRIKIPVGVSYNSDVRKAIALCVEAAKMTDRVIETPEPRCLLVGFGDSSVDLEIRLWICDAPAGVRNVSSDVLLNVWDLFHQHGIEIPFPQRDLHIRSAQGLNDRLATLSAA